MTTSLIDPAVVSGTVGAVSTPCECPPAMQCIAHGDGDCDRGAEFMLVAAHTADPGVEQCRVRVAAICVTCLPQVVTWARMTVQLARRRSHGCCPLCGSPIGHVSDLITSVVAL